MIRPDNLIFDVFFMDEKVGHVIINNSILVENKVYTDVWYKHPFPKSKTFDTVFGILKDRVFPYERDNRDDLLNCMGLKDYNIYDILEKTHGVDIDDFTWFKFASDPDDLKFEDVYPCNERL